ncbi:hypothetical protein PHMEG_00019182 [Phytophthora megakarya]|uniref:Eukaryotic/viral aspartic protease n=1 Tax=Phytophthora megakarya TaxID=4795 RepID=A0A225VTP4_9STRA|nr:hypothetical protein PHMEG_00019182 [Phytophthora megakarya]
MLDTSSWIQLFAPKAARQAVWAELVEELSHPLTLTHRRQLSPTGLRRKQALRCRELSWQIRELTAMGEMDPTPRFEIAQHRPLGKITSFRGRRDESENSMQWLRGFVYEMKLLDIHTLEDIVSDIQTVEKRVSNRTSSQSSSRRDDKRHTSSSGSYGRHDSHSHSQERSRSEPLHTSRVALAEASVTNLITELQTRALSERPNGYSNEYSNDYSKVRILIPTKTRDWLQLQTTMNGETLLTGHSREVISVHKTMDNSQVDLVKVDSDLQLNLDRGSTTTVQMHDFGKCEAFDELTKILRTNVDKKNISPELQKLGFCEWPEDNNNNNENEQNVEFNGEGGVCLDGDTFHKINEDTTTKKVVDDDWLVSICETSEAAPMHAKTKLDEYSSDGDDSLSQDGQWSMEPVAWGVDSATDGSPVGDDPVSAAVALGASTLTPTESSDVDQGCNNPPTETHSDGKLPDAAVADLEHTFMCVMQVLSTEGNNDPADDDYAVHEANYISLEDYAQELTFLPDLTEPSVTELDYTAPNVKKSSFVDDQQRRLDEVLKKHEAIMVSSGNALPPPAYGVAGLIAFSGSPWVSPIVIVLKKNGQDIRLCIGYKMVNAVTVIMEYAMPLVDDLLTELENACGSVRWMPQNSMIYGPSSDDIKVENASSETFAQILDGKTRRIHAMDSDILLQRKTFADFAHQERAEVSATTRSQTKTKQKRVHFEDEVPEGTTNAEATEAVNENSETQEQRKRKCNDQVLRSDTNQQPMTLTMSQRKKSEDAVSPRPRTRS